MYSNTLVIYCNLKSEEDVEILDILAENCAMKSSFGTTFYKKHRNRYIVFTGLYNSRCILKFEVAAWSMIHGVSCKLNTTGR